MNQSLQNERHKQNLNNPINLFPKLKDVIDSYYYFVLCKFCGFQVSFTSIKDLVCHCIECISIDSSNFKDQIQEMVIQNYLKDKKDEKAILIIDQQVNSELDVQSILHIGNLSQGSKNLYQSALKKLISKPETKSFSRLQPEELMHLIQYQCKSMNQVNALIRFQKSTNIPMSQELKEVIKQKQRILKETAQKRPHRSWNLIYIQMFLDELFICKRDFLAFRLFILYELAARISELAQISFQMGINSIINYVPKKQQRIGKNAERRFKINENVQKYTKLFIDRNNINQGQTLNMGLNKKLNKSQSYHKQLKYALKLIKSRQTNASDDYNELLTKFSYHDLRYCKLQELHKSGIEERLIQKFVKHSNFKTTQLYIQDHQNNEVVDFNLIATKLSEQVVYKSAELILNFKGDHDYY